MDYAALVAWLITAGGGFYLFATWLSNGGMGRDGTATSRIPPALILGHAGVAVAGLLVWIAYLASDASETLAWVAVGLLGAVAVLGFTMFFRWLNGRPRGAGLPDERLAEQHFPLVVVVAHGALAVATVVLATVAAVAAT